MFRVSTTSIIRITPNCNYSLWYWSYILCSYLPPTWPNYLATLEWGSCKVPEAVVTVLCTLDDGRGWHPKHVEWTCGIINRLLCVASRWTIINMGLKEFHFTYKVYHNSSTEKKVLYLFSVCNVVVITPDGGADKHSGGGGTTWLDNRVKVNVTLWTCRAGTDGNYR